jgi:hypothetical protein
MSFFKNFINKIINYIKYNNLEIIAYILVFFLVFFFCKFFLFFLFFVKSLLFFFKDLFNNFYLFIENFISSKLGLEFSNNFKNDIDTTTNTDGEDLLVYLNDFIEITLSERSIFFDVILSSPFEYFFLIFTTLLISYLLLNDKIKSPMSLFKYLYNYFKNK